MTPTLDILIERWQRREETWAAAGMPRASARARRYREALERLRELQRSR